MKSTAAQHGLDVTNRVVYDNGRQEFVRNGFLLALLVGTLAPMLFFIWLSDREPSGYSLPGMKSVLLFLGTAHVPATLFFYTDKDFSGIIRHSKARYIYVPLLVTIGTGVLFVLATPAMQSYVFLTFWAWQAFHYGRQNIGVYSFVSLARNAAPPRRMEKLAIELGTYCGILGTFQILGAGVAPNYLKGMLALLFEVGRYGFAAVLLFSLYVYARNFRETTFLRSIFFFTLTFFFLPIYLSNNINVTFLSYAIAHGLQYIVFMTVASASLHRHQDTRRWQPANALKLCGFILLGGVLFYFAGSTKSFDVVKASASLSKGLDFVIGTILGATMAHFLIDADAWRLSKAAQKKYMKERFGFIFNNGAIVKPRAE